MRTFGTIAEGPTDQTVIENILHGYFATPEEEPVVNPVQPPRPLTETPGGWGHVIQSLKKREYDGALQWNDYLVIHIDADRQDEYGVPRFEAGRELTIPERVERIIERLKREIDDSFYHAHAGRILFAITVDSIECWLLPLLYNDNKAAKTSGCFDAANRALAQADRPLLALSGEAGLKAYDHASSHYRKKKTLMKLQGKNESLALFVKELDRLHSRLSASPGAGPPEQDDIATGGEQPPGNSAGGSTSGELSP